jgi:hypothetical protein
MKKKLIDTITCNEDQVRFEIFAGICPETSAGEKLWIMERQQRIAENTSLRLDREKLQEKITMLESKLNKKEDNTMQDNVIDLKKHVADKNKATDNTLPPIDNWLSKLKVGTTILVSSNDGNPMVSEYDVVMITEKSVELLSNLNEPEVFIWVNPIRFCKYYSLQEILHEPETEEQQ